jgi:hypothetical protein
MRWEGIGPEEPKANPKLQQLGDGYVTVRKPFEASVSDTSPCSTCGKPIVWVRMQSGKAMPCDPGNVTIVTDDGRVVRGRIAHWATCPTADQHRRKA